MGIIESCLKVVDTVCYNDVDSEDDDDEEEEEEGMDELDVRVRAKKAKSTRVYYRASVDPDMVKPKPEVKREQKKPEVYTIKVEDVKLDDLNNNEGEREDDEETSVIPIEKCLTVRVTDLDEVMVNKNMDPETAQIIDAEIVRAKLRLNGMNGLNGLTGLNGITKLNGIAQVHGIGKVNGIRRDILPDWTEVDIPMADDTDRVDGHVDSISLPPSEGHAGITSQQYNVDIPLDTLLVSGCSETYLDDLPAPPTYDDVHTEFTPDSKVDNQTYKGVRGMMILPDLKRILAERERELEDGDTYKTRLAKRKVVLTY